MSSRSTVSVALIGNVANCLLPVAIALRDAGVGADLFDDDGASITARPASAGTDLAGETWIRRGPWFAPSVAVAPWRAPVVELLRQYDLVIASGPGPLVAQWTGRPWCWWASGADLTVTPFPFAFRSIYPSFKRKVAAYPLAWWQRRAARRASELWVQPFAPYRDAVQRLRLGSPPVSDRYMPLIVDVDEFSADRVLEPDARLNAVVDRMAQASLVVLHPSRILIQATPANRRAGQWKGNDELVRGFHRYVQRSRDNDALLVMPDTSASRDLDLAKRLVVDLGLERNVLWASPPRPEGFTRKELAHLYARSHVVADEFAVGWFGYVTLEGLSMGRPVISRLDDGAMRTLYPAGDPIVRANDAAEIAARLEMLAVPSNRQAVGAASRRWVVEHHAPASVGARYLEAVLGVLELRADRRSVDRD